MVSAILEAAERLLAEQGLARTGMRAIARTAGVSAGSLYQYFDGKESVLGSLIDQRFESDLKAVEALLVTAQDESLEVCVRRGVALLVPEKEWKKEAMIAMADHMGDVHQSKRLSSLMKELVRLLGQFLEAHPEVDVENTGRSATTLVYSLREAAFAAMRQEETYAAELIRDDLSQLALGYLARVNRSSHRQH